jgi:C1A family cysteine protease
MDTMPVLGYRIDREDKQWLENRSQSLTTLRGMVFSAPEEIDPRPWHRIENQKSMGSCQGHANSSVCEMCYHIATGEVIQFSPMWAYIMTQKIDGLLGRDQGSTIAGGVKMAMILGSCPADVFPYPNPPKYSTEIPEGAEEAAAPFKIRSHIVCKSYADVFAFLASGQGGVEIGISWGNGLQVNAEGCVEQYRPGPGGHAVSFLGYSKRKDGKGRKYLWLANSWSETWGDKGWAEVSPAAVDQMCADQWTVMIGMSDLITPTPRKIDWTTKEMIG